MGTHVEKLPCFGDRPALVVLDDYSIGFEEERLIREGVYRLAVIDDLVRRHTCDVLFDGNILRTPEEYSESAATVGKMCCGPEYSLSGGTSSTQVAQGLRLSGSALSRSAGAIRSTASGRS